MKQEYTVKEVFDEKSKTIEDKLQEIFISFLIEKQDFWDTKYKDNSGYADYTIGGPTIEMLFASYNQTHGTNYGAKAYKAEEKNSSDEIIANYDGYKINKNKDKERSDDWQAIIVGMLDNKINEKYNSVYVNENTITNAIAYWLASPSERGSKHMLAAGVWRWYWL